MSAYQDLGGTPAVVSIIVGAIITWVVSKYYANKARNAKALGWTPLGISRIVTRPVVDVAKGLALTWNSVPLRTPYTVSIRISNLGSREVIGGLTSPGRSDYIQPLVVNFGNSICYEATISDSHRVPLSGPVPIISSPSAKFEIPMPTLNMASWLRVEMIADGVAKYPEISCFLEGQTEEIKAVAGRQRSGIRSAMLISCSIGVLFLIIGFGLLGLLAYNPQGPGDGPAILMIFGTTIAVLAIFGFSLAWFLDRRDWNAMKGKIPGLFTKHDGMQSR